MKKITKKWYLIILAIFIWLILTTKSFAGDQDLNELNFTVDLQSNGDMKITEIWDVDIYDTNTLFKNFKYDSNKFENVSVQNLEISQNGLANLNTLGNLKVTNLTITGQVNSNQKARIADLRNFKNAESVKSLTLTDSENLKTLAGIEKFTGLTSLTIQNCPNLIDITGLGNCTNLQELTIQSCKVGDITEIGNLANLTKLYLGSNNFVNISALSKLKNIKELDLHSNSIVDIEPLENMIVNSKIGFSTLNLSDNLISNIAVSGHDNISTLKLLNKAGLQSLDISNTEINDSGKEELKKVYKDLKY